MKKKKMKRDSKVQYGHGSFCPVLLRDKRYELSLTSDSTSMTSSPAFGSSRQPRTSTGVAGGAFWTGLPVSVNIARTFAQAFPATRTAPFLSVPRWTIIVTSFLQISTETEL
jgi:hypothetical protein